jgi:hypothetical protein
MVKAKAALLYKSHEIGKRDILKAIIFKIEGERKKRKIHNFWTRKQETPRIFKVVYN